MLEVSSKRYNRKVAMNALFAGCFSVITNDVLDLESYFGPSSDYPVSLLNRSIRAIHLVSPLALPRALVHYRFSGGLTAAPSWQSTLLSLQISALHPASPESVLLLSSKFLWFYYPTKMYFPKNVHVTRSKEECRGFTENDAGGPNTFITPVKTT